MSKTDFLGLTLTDALETGLTFLEWRTLMNGVECNSNMELIDRTCNKLNTSIGGKADGFSFDSNTGILQLTSEGKAISGASVTIDLSNYYTKAEMNETLSTLEGAVDGVANGVTDIRAYLGYYDNDVVGLQVDFKNRTYTRLAGATNLTSGTDFDKFPMYSGRRRCVVADNGTIIAYWGDEGFSDDGSIGQVMVYQPKFYYLVCPVEYDPIVVGSEDKGYHLRKVNYYVSSYPKQGFKLHPAFYDVNGNEIDYILYSAYEGSLWDADGGENGAGTYIGNDQVTPDVNTDMLCSIAGMKPTSTISLLQASKLAQNRGSGWHCDTIKTLSANQLLMMIEMGTLNMQTAIGSGITTIDGDYSCNRSSYTGSTRGLGHSTGVAELTVNENNGTVTPYTENGKVAITYRGIENPWGNILKSIQGIICLGFGSGGAIPYICSDFNFSDGSLINDYKSAGFHLSNSGGYISAFGYSSDFDWLFLPSETLGASNAPVGDYAYITPDVGGSRTLKYGGCWSYGAPAGIACIDSRGLFTSSDKGIGARMVYIPTYIP